jgi:hypothetical protein
MYLRQAIEERRESFPIMVPVETVSFQDDFCTGHPCHCGIVPPGTIVSVSSSPTPASELVAAQMKIETRSVGEMLGESIAQEAHRLVLGDRGESYGHPIFDMTRSADLLTALLRNKLRPGVRLEAEDMGQAMICVKQSRHRNKPKRDNLTDTAGYALTLQMIAEWRAAHPGQDPRDHF